MQTDFQIGEWVVRPKRDCIERGEKTVHLKPKAMAVLSRLADSEGEVVTRSELFDSVWPGSAVSDAVLTQCVAELRQAFGESARDARIIETIPRVGFRLVPQDISPENETALPDINAASHREDTRKPTAKIGRGLIAGVLLIIAVITGYDAFAPEPGTSRPLANEKTIAVLPFVDMSEAGDRAYFADGLTEELINRLSRLEGLQVASRTASFQFEGKSEDMAAIAETLNVAWVLEGSIRNSGQDIRITAQLINTGSGFHLWSETFDLPVEDIFTVQGEFSESVAIAVAITLDVGEYAGDPLATSSVEAYEEVLKSQDAHKEFTADSLLRAIHHARRAVEIDPEYGYAWYGLASLYREAGTFKGVIAKEDWMQLAAEALDRAIEVDPDPNAGWAEKITLAELDHRWTDAQELLGPITGREMVEDDPRNFQYAYILYDVGRVQEATPLMEHWKRLHPGGPGTHGGLAIMYTAQERFEEAFAEVESAYASQMYSELGALAGVIVALSANDRAQLLRWLELVIEHTEGEGPAFWQAMNDTLDDPLAALAYLRSVDSDRLAYATSIWAAWHGDIDLALKAMSRSDTTYAFWLPLMADVRRHPGFKELARDMNLVEYWREYEWSDFCSSVGEDDFECE